MGKPLDPRVEIGRVRLIVSNLDRALVFYNGVLGFDVTHRVGAAGAYLGAGGFHHHIALTTDSRDGAAHEQTARFAIRFPDRVALANALLRLDEAHVALLRSSDDGVSEALFVRDPGRQRDELYVDHPRHGQATVTSGDQAAVREVQLDALRALASRPAEASSSGAVAGISDTSRQRLRDLRARLLHLHKVLLDDAKAAYEMDRGRVGSNAQPAAARHQRSVVRVAALAVGDGGADRRDGRTGMPRRPGRRVGAGRAGGAAADRVGEPATDSPAATTRRCSVSRPSCWRTPTCGAR